MVPVARSSLLFCARGEYIFEPKFPTRTMVAFLFGLLMGFSFSDVRRENMVTLSVFSPDGCSRRDGVPDCPGIESRDAGNGEPGALYGSCPRKSPYTLIPPCVK